MPDEIKVQIVRSDKAGRPFEVTDDEYELIIERRKQKAAKAEAAKKARDVDDDDDNPHFLN